MCHILPEWRGWVNRINENDDPAYSLYPRQSNRYGYQSRRRKILNSILLKFASMLTLSYSAHGGVVGKYILSNQHLIIIFLYRWLIAHLLSNCIFDWKWLYSPSTINFFNLWFLLCTIKCTQILYFEAFFQNCYLYHYFDCCPLQSSDLINSLWVI